MPNKPNTNPRLDWCKVCGKFYPHTNGAYCCPACSSPFTTCKCTRCGHEWTPMSIIKRPKQCVKCKQVNYDRMKSMKRKDIDG